MFISLLAFSDLILFLTFGILGVRHFWTTSKLQKLFSLEITLFVVAIVVFFTVKKTFGASDNVDPRAVEQGTIDNQFEIDNDY